MIKIKIFKGEGAYKVIGSTHIHFAHYYYNVYLFGILIHSVTLVDVDSDSAKNIFGNKKIIK